jgi:glyoxylase I family protein
MQIQRIHHVAIICSDYQRSRHFYVNVLGCQILAETFRAERNSYKLDLRIGVQDQIELFSFPDPPARVSRPEACGLRHLSFLVEDLDRTVMELRSHQIAVEPIRVDELTGQRFTFCRDPDQLPLEFYEAK